MKTTLPFLGKKEENPYIGIKAILQETQGVGVKSMGMEKRSPGRGRGSSFFVLHSGLKSHVLRGRAHDLKGLERGL